MASVLLNWLCCLSGGRRIGTACRAPFRRSILSRPPNGSFRPKGAIPWLPGQDSWPALRRSRTFGCRLPKNHGQLIHSAGTSGRTPNACRHIAHGVANGIAQRQRHNCEEGTNNGENQCIFGSRSTAIVPKHFDGSFHYPSLADPSPARIAANWRATRAARRKPCSAPGTSFMKLSPELFWRGPGRVVTWWSYCSMVMRAIRVSHYEPSVRSPQCPFSTHSRH